MLVANDTVPYPTVLVALDDDALDGSLVQGLRARGFLVLEADDWDQVLHVVKTHSRPIQVMVTTDNLATHASILKQHRPHLQILFVKRPADANQVLMQVRQVFGPSPAAMPIGKASEIRERTLEVQVVMMRA